MKTTRRSFLRELGAGTMGAWLLPLLPRDALGQQESLPQPVDPRLKHHYLSVCRQCSAGCGVVAEVVQGKVKKLLGNPLHPANRGTLCAKGLSALQLYYNPDRIRTPLRRAGARGAGRWEPIGWDQALRMLGERLVQLRSGGKTYALAMLTEEMGGLEGVLARRFCEAYGTPNYLDRSKYPGEGLVNAAALMQGLGQPPIFDLRNASFLISFNVPFLETSRNSVQTWKGFAEFRTGKGHPRGRFVHFSPARDLTASKADEWIPIKPGTEGAVALGMTYVMLQEGLYNHDFVKSRCQGFERQREGNEELPGFQEHVLKHYKPSWVAQVTGAPAEKIVGLAREFALARAPLALWQDQAGIAAQPLATQMAIHSLNALVGNIDAPGGVLTPRALPGRLAPEPVKDRAARDGLARAPAVAVPPAKCVAAETASAIFPDRIVQGYPYPIEVLFIYRANPVFDELNGARYRQALGKVGFSACVSGHHNDTTAWCDLVLPESHGLESWYAGASYTGEGYPLLNLAEPAVPARYQTRNVADVLLDLARRCGGTVRQSLPWPRFQDAAYAYLGQINDLEAGDVFARPYQEPLTRLLERIGWRTRLGEPHGRFWRDCLASGGWWDPIYYHREWDRCIRTASDRFEFFPQAAWKRLQGLRKGHPLTEEDKARLLPHHAVSELAQERSAYPLTLLVCALPSLERVESPNQPWLQEVEGAEREHWRTWLDVNPEDARRYRLAERDDVWLESSRGKLCVRCRFDQGIQPGTVRISFGLGHAAGGRWMRGIGVTPAAVLAEAYDPGAGTPNWQTTRVRIRKA